MELARRGYYDDVKFHRIIKVLACFILFLMVLCYFIFCNFFLFLIFFNVYFRILLFKEGIRRGLGKVVNPYLGTFLFSSLLLQYCFQHETSLFWTQPFVLWQLPLCFKRMLRIAGIREE